MLEIFIFLQKSVQNNLQKKVNLERKTPHAVITHANTSNGIKIPTYFENSWGMMLNLSNAPLKHHETSCSVYTSLEFCFTMIFRALIVYNADIQFVLRAYN